MLVGYIRISTVGQNTARQEVLMQELGVERIFVDRLSGKNTDRQQLKEMMAFVRQGDTVVVESISRFARNTKELLELVEQLTAKGVEFVPKKETIDTTTPTGKFMLTIFGAVAELEREYILQRQSEGIAIAKEQGVYKGRQPIVWPEFEQIVKLWRSGKMTAVEAMKRLDMKPSTFYRRVKELSYDRTDVVYRGICCNTGNYHDCRYQRLLPDRKKMIPVLAAALLEAFTKGAALAVSIFLLWKNEEKRG